MERAERCGYGRKRKTEGCKGGDRNRRADKDIWKKPGCGRNIIYGRGRGYLRFLGPNGAGKSTTIRSMLGLLTFSEGTIKLLQMDSKKRQKQILRQVGYMPSEAFIYPSMKVKEVVRFAAQARKQDCAKEAERLCEILEVDREKRSGNCLSATGKKSALSAQCSIDRSY